MKVAWLPASLREGLRSACTPRAISPNLPTRRAVLKASTKQFSTSTRLRAGIAAPAIKFGGEIGVDGESHEAPFFARLIPDSPSYFTAQPIFIDDLLALQVSCHILIGLGGSPGVLARILGHFEGSP